MSNKLKYYIVTITRKQEAEIVVQAESQEKAFDIAENYVPGNEVEWHCTPGSRGVDREDWEDGELEAEKVTAYKSIKGNAIMPCPDRLVVSAESEKRRWEAASAPGMYSVALEMLTESLKKEKSDED